MQHECSIGSQEITIIKLKMNLLRFVLIKYTTVKSACDTAIGGWSTNLEMPHRRGRHLVVTHIGCESGELKVCFKENRKLSRTHKC